MPMETRIEEASNQRHLKKIDKLVDEIKREACRPGFYGEIGVRLVYNDGVIKRVHLERSDSYQ